MKSIAGTIHDAKGVVLKGINLLTCMVRYGDFSVPVGYEVIKKDVLYSDVKTRQIRRKSSVTKNELFRDLIDQAVKNQVLFDYILADNWFGSKANMAHIHNDLHKSFIIGMKSNRTLALSENDANNGRYQQVKTLELEEDVAHTVWLKGLDFPVRLLKKVFKNENGSTGILYLVSNDMTSTTVNRVLELVRAILNRAHKEWGWLDKTPIIRMRKIENKRIRWLTKEEANLLLKELPSHLEAMASFTLATGLRESNVTQLKWSEINLDKKHALIHADESKSKRPIPVPLNKQAISILKAQQGRNSTYVFTYNGNPVTRCNNHAWQKALVRAGINDFRWHDLRHTWASWHVQNGTPLHELQQLGGWANYEMVLRYAHLSSEHLRRAAERL